MANDALTPEQNTIKRIASEIAAELREHPDRWFKGALVRFADGAMTSSGHGLNRNDAVCWCLEGLVYKRLDDTIRHQALEAFVGRIKEQRLITPYNTVHGWNDAPERTVHDVIELCDKVAAS